MDKSCKLYYLLALLFGIPACRTSAFSLALLSSAPPTNNYRCTASTCLFGINNEKSGVAVAVHVRDCLYGELHPVSNLVVASFYDSEKDEVWKQMFRLAELSRMQKNFPYSDVGRHRMLVAVAEGTDHIVGFVDVDNRPSSPSIDLPTDARPMLSDLMVCPTTRRQGIAQKLVLKCERICVSDFKATELYIRVLEDNDAAMQMYSKLGYEIMDNPDDPPTVKLLHKALSSMQDETTKV